MATQPPAVIANAHAWLVEALAQIDGPALLTSPYLSFDACDLVARAATTSSFPFVLVTTLDPSAVANGYLTVEGLERLLAAGVEVRHTERLHAKCFMVGSRAMLGSANLTGAGLGSSASPNREMGVELDNRQSEAARHLMAQWPARVVDDHDLDDLRERSRALTRVTLTQDKPLDASSALQRAEQLLQDARDAGRGLWLKLEYGDPALEGWRRQSWFASPKKGRPGFTPGDLVFICAKATHDCYAVVEVASEPEHQPEFYAQWCAEHDPEALERWPWVNTTIPRFVPVDLMPLKLTELGVKGGGLQNGHVRLEFDQFTAGVRALARLAGD